MSILQTLKQTVLPDGTKLAAVTAFATLRPYLHCDFPTFLRAMGAEVPIGLLAIQQTVQKLGFSDAQAVELVGAYLDSLSQTNTWSLADFMKQVLDQVRAHQTDREIEAFADRVVGANNSGQLRPPEPAAPAPAPTPAPTPAPAPNAPPFEPTQHAPVSNPTPPAQPQGLMSQAPAPAAPAGFGWGAPPAATPAPAPTAQPVSTEAAPPPSTNMTFQAPVAQNVAAPMSPPPPVPDTIRAGARIAYEHGPQTRQGFIVTVNDRHASIMLDDLTTIHMVAPQYLQISTEPVLFRVEFDQTMLDRIQHFVTMTELYQGHENGAVLTPLAFGESSSPLTGERITISLDVVNHPEGPYLSYRIERASGDQAVLASLPISRIFTPEWRLEWGGIPFVTAITVKAVEPAPNAEAPPADGKKAGRKTTTRRTAKKAEPETSS